MISGLHAALTPGDAAVVAERPAGAGPDAGMSISVRGDIAAAATYRVTARSLARERPDVVVVVVVAVVSAGRPSGAQVDLLVGSDGLPEYGVAVHLLVWVEVLLSGPQMRGPQLRDIRAACVPKPLARARYVISAVEGCKGAVCGATTGRRARERKRVVDVLMAGGPERRVYVGAISVACPELVR